jgi:hypothetical protein
LFSLRRESFLLLAVLLKVELLRSTGRFSFLLIALAKYDERERERKGEKRRGLEKRKNDKDIIEE